MELKQVIVVRADLKMGRGKLAAQCSHASLAAMENAERADPELGKEWKNQGMKKVVLRVESEKELVMLFQEIKDARLKPALIRDAGLTQTEPGTKTCFGVGPADETKIDGFTKGLRLL